MTLGASYATLATLKARLGGIGDTIDDTRLQSALDAATQSVEGICGRQFNDSGSATARVYYPDSPTKIYVDDFSTTAGLVVKVDYGNAGNYSQTITSTNYQLEPLNGVVGGMTGYPFNCIRSINQYLPLWYGSIGYPRASVQVTAQWGWAAVPASVVEACLILGEEIFKMKDAPWGVAGFGAMGVVRIRQENPKVMALLNDLIRDPIQAR